ncbi:unnamed protein product [Gadus morhua 'NCC']
MAASAAGVARFAASSLLASSLLASSPAASSPARPAPAWRETVSLKQRGILGHDDDDDDDEDDDDDDDEDEDDDDEEERPVVVPVRAVSRALPWANKKSSKEALKLTLIIIEGLANQHRAVLSDHESCCPAPLRRLPRDRQSPK